MAQEKLYKVLASKVLARKNCETPKWFVDASGESKLEPNMEWREAYKKAILQLVENYMPAGSGFDSGTKIDLDKSHADKLVFRTEFHHMDDTGSYVGWTDHEVTITPSLWGDFHIRVSGYNRNDIKDYIAEMFEVALHMLVEEYPTK